MAKQEFYKFCTFRQETDEGYIETASWIPEEGASVGKSMRLQDPITKEWKEGFWTVVIVNPTTLSKQKVKERINIMRKYRSATDV